MSKVHIKGVGEVLIILGVVVVGLLLNPSIEIVAPFHGIEVLVTVLGVRRQRGFRL